MSIHARLGTAVIVVSAVGGILVLFARRRADAGPTVRVFVRLCALTAGIEAGIGLVLLALGHRPVEGIHYFYGAATVISVPAAELLARRGRPADEPWVLFAGVVATALFALRAVTTGAG